MASLTWCSLRGMICSVLFYFYIVAQGSTMVMKEQETSEVRNAAPLAPATPYRSLTQHEDVVGALRAAGHYAAIAGVLDSYRETILRSGVTIFAPSDEALSNSTHMSVTSNAFVEALNFYTVAVQLPFSKLLRLKVGSRLPTLVPGISILVTSTAPNAYQVDNAVIIDPDLYTDATIAVHGISAILNASEFNQLAGAPLMGYIPGSSPPTTGWPDVLPNSARRDAWGLASTCLFSLTVIGLCLLFQVRDF